MEPFYSYTEVNSIEADPREQLHGATEYQHSSLPPIANIQLPFHTQYRADFLDARKEVRLQDLDHDIEYGAKHFHFTPQPTTNRKALNLSVSKPDKAKSELKDNVEFNFISVEGSRGKPDSDSKRQVRVYAARSTHLRRRQRERKPVSQNVQIIPRGTGQDLVVYGSKKKTKHDKQFVSPKSPPRLQNAVPIQSVESSISVQLSSAKHRTAYDMPSDRISDIGRTLDSYQCFALPVTPHMLERIHHLIHIHGPSTNPRIYGKKHGAVVVPWTFWIEIAKTDAAALYGIVAQASVHRLMLHAKSPNLDRTAGSAKLNETNEANFYLFKTLRLLQQKFDDPKETLSNASIFVVAVLTACVGTAAHATQLQAHYNGLVRMVRLRGGINTFPRVIAYQLSRIDSNAAWMQKHVPQLPFYNMRYKTPASVGFVIEGSSPGNPFTADQFEAFLPPQTFSIACNLFYLTHMLDLHCHTPELFGSNQCEFFEDTFALVQHALVSMPYPSNTSERSVSLHHQHCWRIAALIYFNTALRFCPSPKLLKSMTSRLIEGLRESDTSTGWHPFEDVLLWIYFMGYIGSVDPSVGPEASFEERWFLEEARRLARLVNLKNSDEMGSKMRQMLYRDSSFEHSISRLWEGF